MPRDVHRGHVPDSFASCLAFLKLLDAGKGPEQLIGSSLPG